MNHEDESTRMSVADEARARKVAEKIAIEHWPLVGQVERRVMMQERIAAALINFGQPQLRGVDT